MSLHSLYRKLANWEVDLSESTDQSIKEVLTYQKTEANQEFCKFVRRNYYNWINKRSDETYSEGKGPGEWTRMKM